MGTKARKTRWYTKTVTTGWSKSLSQPTRIAKTLKAHKGDILASARSLQALANVTTDRETKLKAGMDARKLFKRWKRRT